MITGIWLYFQPALYPQCHPAKNIPSADNVVSYCHVPIKAYSRPPPPHTHTHKQVCLGLKLAIKTDRNNFNMTPAVKATLHLDSLWLSFVALRIESISDWRSFNNLVTE